VSAARNRGLRAATGDIVAYIDSDAYADADWLRFLVATFQESDTIGVGGPNLVPPADEWVAKCVYRSPGGPTQVMLDDVSAEHIPGCNMAFKRTALEEIAGFDELFTAAGDDVDVCWRLLERGHRLGFSPSAVVWHHRRPSARAYWRQQVGYGVAESLLERRHPAKFNPWGHTYWGGTIYSPYPQFRLFGQPAIYQGLWGSAPFQAVYDQGGGGALSFLPRAMEMHVALVALAAVSLFFPWALAILGLALLYVGYYCVMSSLEAQTNIFADRPETAGWTERFRWRAVIAWLHFLEPLARDWGRLKGGLTPWRSVLATEVGTHDPDTSTRWWQRINPFVRHVQWSYPGDQRLEKDSLLERLTDTLTSRQCSVGWNSDYDPWDLVIQRGALGKAHVRMVVEHHGGPRRLARFAAEIRPSRAVAWALLSTVGLGAATAALGYPAASAALAAVTAVLWVGPVRESGRIERGLRAATDELCADAT